MTNLPAPQRSLLFKLLILIPVIIAGLLLIAIFRFDIGAYRQEIATQLEKALKKPVQLGRAELSFENGLTIDFYDLVIGDDDSFLLSVPRLSTTLEPWGLLQGEVVIKRILIDSPTLKLKLPLILARTVFNFERLGLKTLRVKEGNLVIIPAKSTQEEIQVDHLNLVLHGLGRGTVSRLVTTATIARQSQTSELKLSLELTRQLPGQDWRQGSLRGNFSLSNIGRFIPGKQRPTWLPNPLDLSFNIEGIPAKGVAINALFDDGQNGSHRLELSSDWQSFASIDQFTNFRLGRTKIPLHGQVELNQQGDGPQLSGQLSLANIEILSLLNSFGLPASEINGQIDRITIKLDGPLHPSAATSFAPFHSARLRLSHLSYTHDQVQLENLGFSLTVTNSEINLSKGQGNINKFPFTFSGSGGPLTRKNFELTFNLHSDLNLEQLQKDFPSPFLSRQKITGVAPLDVQVKGTINNLVTHIELDLTKTELELGKLLIKKPGIPFRINIAGQRIANTLTLDQLQIELDQVEIMASGSLTSGQQGWLGKIAFSPLKLEKLQSTSPIFEHFRINGRAQGQLKLTTKDWQAQIELTAAGAHFTPLIADLKQVRTTLTINRNGIDLGQAHALLGQSPVNVTGNLTNWHTALLTLHVTAKEVRAQDLVFTNQQMKLQNLD
ncbi:MAG: hypothetical protein L3J63_04590, partial [Geopsychrobacter sp.]|nr:hypothetical protein [Geopsychrobacter sp.]